jgi:hypothetical protein
MSTTVHVDWDIHRLILLDSASPRRPHLRWTVRFPQLFSNPVTGETMALTLSSIQSANLSVQPYDAKENVAVLDGPVVWSSTDPTILDVTAGADELSATAVAGKVGHAQVLATADARLGPDVVLLVGTLEVDVIAAEAVTLNITAVPMTSPA